MFNYMIYLDFASDFQYLFQDPSTPMMNGIIDLHHFIMTFLFFVLVFVVVIMLTVINFFVFSNKKYMANKGYYNENYDKTNYNEENNNNLWNYFTNNYNSSKKENNIILNNICSWNNFWSEISSLLSKEQIASVSLKINNESNFSFIHNLNNNITAIKKLSLNTFLTKDNGFANNFSSYLIAIYLKNNNYSNSLPTVVVNSVLTEHLYQGCDNIYAPNIYHSYTLNLYYWMQIYMTVRSGIFKFTHSTEIEIIWTVIPSLILICIGAPSFVLLYAMDEIIEPDFIVKCIGHQWYWSYEVEFPDFFYQYDNNENNIDVLLKIDPNFNTFWNDYIKTISFVSNNDDNLNNLRWGYLSFSSYMKNEGDLEKGELRLLEVDNPLVLPVKTHIDLLVTANDVLHSWAMPSFGVKMDAVPGRLNHANVFIERTGVFYGQCSEICGVNHGFMPIKVIAVPFEEFLSYIPK